MEMTASERLIATMSGKPLDRLPAIEWAPWWHLTVNRWLEEGLPSEYANTEALQGYFGLDRCLQTYVPNRTVTTPNAPGFGLGIMEDENDYETVVKPTLFPDVDKVVSNEHFEWLKRTHARGDTLHFFTVDGFFWNPRTLFGIENHLYAFYDYPDLMKQMCTDYMEWLKKLFDRVFSEFRFDFMSFQEDMSYNLGPMISAEQFDEFLAPFYREMIPLIHSYGVPVFIDSDGDITKAVDWYASVGADGMFPLERQAGVDVSLYIDKQPDMCFLGHFDKMCMKFGEDAMRAEFERLLPSLIRGKVIPSVDHQTPPDVPMENYRIYVKLLKEYTARAEIVRARETGTITPCPVFR